MMAKTVETKRYYVRNPIMIGAHRGLVHVVGYDETKGNKAPYSIPRGHLVDIPTEGAEAITARWIANKCIEPYDAKLHPDAFKGANPVPEPVEEVVVPAARPEKSNQSKPIIDETDDLPKVDQPKATPKGDQAKAIGGRKY
jgi:hypothetical protein